MLKFWLINILLLAGAVLALYFIINLLKLSWEIFKAVLVILIVLLLVSVILYYTGLLEKIPFLYRYFMKFRELIIPAADKAVDTAKSLV
ncbi:MAG: hypothetical protein WCK36_01030 [Candidatus Firestonebacteria bacterium]